MDAQFANSSHANDIVEQLRAQLKASEKIISDLQQEKQEMGADFEFKRAKIKDLYYAKESTIRELNSKLLESCQRVSALETTVADLEEEIDNVKMIASVSENTKQEAVEDLNKTHQQEIESMRCVLQDTMEEQRRELIGQFEQERRRWDQERLKVIKERDDAKDLVADLRGVMKTKSEEQVLKDDQLGVTMEAAQSEAKALQAVVIPLEAEIAELKKKLISTEKLLENERFKLNSHKLETLFFNEIDQQLEDELVENQSSRCFTGGVVGQQEIEEKRVCQPSYMDVDLENCIEMLQQQKLTLQKENDILKGEMHEVCRAFEQKIANYNSLKESWRATKDLRVACIENMDLLRFTTSEELWKKIEKVLNNEASTEDDPGSRSVVNPSEPRTTQELNEKDTDEFLPFQSYVVSRVEEKTCDSVSTMVTESQDDISVTSVSSLPEATGIGEGKKAQRVSSAPHLNLLGRENISERKSLTVVHAWDEVPPKSNLIFETTPSPNVKKAAKDFESMETEFSELQERCVELKIKYEDEKKSRMFLETDIAEAAKKSRQEIRELEKKINLLEKKLEEDRAWRKQKETEDDKKLNLVQRDRDQIYLEYQRLKKENENVKFSYEKHRIDLSKEPVFSLNIEGLRFQVHKYREALLAAQVEKSHVESVLQSRLSFTNDRLNAEQNAKEQLEETFISEIQSLRKELSQKHEVENQLQKEINVKKEVLAQLKRYEHDFKELRTKSNEIIRDLKAKLKAETESKGEMEQKLLASRNQVRSLQDSLQTSEHVQKDFVKLSQSLQMQLEEIRLKEEGKVPVLTSTSIASVTSSENHNPG